MFILLASFALATQPISQDESLHVRRIMTLWKDQDYATADAQIQLFGQTYPKSPLLDRLKLLQADRAWAQGSHAKALSHYDAIRSKNLSEEFFPQLVDCLYHEKQFDRLAALLENRVQDETLNERQERWTLYYAEALQHIHPDPSRARHQYERLLNSSYALQAHLALTELTDAKTAASHYLYLAQALPNQKDAFLLRAAQLQLTYSHLDALETLSKTQLYTENQAPSAALTQAWLLFETGEHKQLLDLQPQLEATVTTDQQPVLSYFLGRAHLSLKHYAEALILLEPLLQQPTLTFSDEKELLLALMMCAKQTREIRKVQEWADRFEKNYPDDPRLPQAQLILALAYRENGQNEKAEQILTSLPESEAVRLELGLLQLRNGNVDKSRRTLKQLLKNYPDGCYRNETQTALALIAIQKIDTDEFAELVELRGQETLLKKLADSPDALPRVYLALGRILEEKGDILNACEAYRQVLATWKRDVPIIRDRAQLHLARLLYSTEPHLSLDLLKELQLRRRLEHEPIYLEAAYDYARWMAEGVPLEQRESTWLDHLQAAKQTWTSTDDVVSQDYHTLRAQLPEKDLVYQAYLMLFDARTLQLQSQIASRNGRRDEAQQKRQLALSMYQNLTEGPLAVSKDLMHLAEQEKALLQKEDSRLY